MRATSPVSIAFVFAYGVLLAACGGGGDAGGTTGPQPVAPTVSLSPSTLELRGVATTGTSTATLTPVSATVAWRSENASVATVSGSGGTATITAVSAGTVQVVATATNGTLTAEARVAVTVVPIVRAIALTPLSANVAVGGVQQLTANVSADAGASTELTWSSSDITRARVDANGLVTAVAPGAVNIVATSKATPTVTGQATITVFEPLRVQSVTVSPSMETALTGQTRAFTAAVVADGDLPKTVTWRSSSNTIATIAPDGVATAVSPGTTTLTAVSTADPNVSSTATLVVRAPTVQGITLSVRTTTLLTGDTVYVTPTVTADAGVSTALTYISSAVGTATVAAVGAKAFVTAIAPGISTITATSVANPLVQATIMVQISAPPALTQWVESNDGRTANVDVLPAIWSMAALPSGTVVAVGLNGAIAERTGNTWARVTSPTAHRLHAVVVAAGTAFAVGGGGTVLRRTAGGWVTETFPSTDSLLRVAIRDDGTGAAFSATGNRVFERSAAGVWTLFAGPYNELDYLRRFTVAAAGSPVYAAVPSSSPMYATADVMRWDGANWIPIPRHNTSSDRGVNLLPLPGGDLLIAGPENFKVYIARWNGTSWVREYTEAVGTTANFAWFWPCADGSIVVSTVRGELLRRNAGAWITMPLGNAAEVPNGTIACATPLNVVGGGPSRLWSYNGATFSFDAYSMSMNRLSLGSSTNIWASQASSDLALQYNGTAWSPVPLRPNGSFNNSAPALAAFDNGGAFVVTANHNATRTGGAAWNWLANTDTRATELWGTSETDLWAVGQSSTMRGLARRIGSSWSTVTPGAYQFDNFEAVHGASGNAVMAVRSGTPGVVARWNGSTLRFDSVSVGFTSLLDIAVLSGSEAMAAGTSGTYRWNGTTWTTFPCCATETPVTIAGRLPAEYYLFGSKGGVYTFSSGVWRKVGQLSRVVRRARMTADAAVAVGDDGLVVYGRPSGAMIRR